MSPASGAPTVRLLVAHDADGRIASLAVSPADGPVSTPRGAQTVTEVDASSLNLPTADDAMGERLLEIAQHYRVERGSASATARLIPSKG